MEGPRLIGYLLLIESPPGDTHRWSPTCLPLHFSDPGPSVTVILLRFSRQRASPVWIPFFGLGPRSLVTGCQGILTHSCGKPPHSTLILRACHPNTTHLSKPLNLAQAQRHLGYLPVTKRTWVRIPLRSGRTVSYSGLVSLKTRESPNLSASPFLGVVPRPSVIEDRRPWVRIPLGHYLSGSQAA